MNCADRKWLRPDEKSKEKAAILGQFYKPSKKRFWVQTQPKNGSNSRRLRINWQKKTSEDTDTKEEI